MKADDLSRADRLFAKRALFHKPRRTHWPVFAWTIALAIVVAIFLAAQQGSLAALF